jgi:hypothetical protein
MGSPSVTHTQAAAHLWTGSPSKKVRQDRAKPCSRTFRSPLPAPHKIVTLFTPKTTSDSKLEYLFHIIPIMTTWAIFKNAKHLVAKIFIEFFCLPIERIQMGHVPT